jgi:hypothetical protein
MNWIKRLFQGESKPTHAIVQSIYSGPSGPVSFMPFKTRSEAVEHMNKIREGLIAEGKAIGDLKDKPNFCIMEGENKTWSRVQYHLTRIEEL